MTFRVDQETQIVYGDNQGDMSYGGNIECGAVEQIYGSQFVTERYPGMIPDLFCERSGYPVPMQFEFRDKFGPEQTIIIGETLKKEWKQSEAVTGLQFGESLNQSQDVCLYTRIELHRPTHVNPERKGGPFTHFYCPADPG